MVVFSKNLCEEKQIIAIPGQEILVQHLGYGQSTILDKQLLRNICINLLNNDIKYSADATPIEFTDSLGKKLLSLLRIMDWEFRPLISRTSLNDSSEPVM